MLWLATGAGVELRPAVAHGYSHEALARMPPLARSANNAAAAGPHRRPADRAVAPGSVEGSYRGSGVVGEWLHRCSVGRGPRWRRDFLHRASIGRHLRCATRRHVVVAAGNERTAGHWIRRNVASFLRPGAIGSTESCRAPIRAWPSTCSPSCRGRFRSRFPHLLSFSQGEGEIGPRTDGHGPHLRDDVTSFQARPRRRRIGRHGSHEHAFFRTKVVGQLRRQVFDSDT